MRCFSEELNDWYKSEVRDEKIKMIMMKIHRLVVTKTGSHYWRRVNNIKKEGVFIVDIDGDVTIFHNKKVIPDYGSLIDLIETLTTQRLRDSKIERVLN